MGKARKKKRLSAQYYIYIDNCTEIKIRLSDHHYVNPVSVIEINGFLFTNYFDLPPIVEHDKKEKLEELIALFALTGETINDERLEIDCDNDERRIKIMMECAELLKKL